MNNLILLANCIVPGYITLQIANILKPQKKYKEVPFLINCIIFSFINIYLYKLISIISAIKTMNSYLVILVISILFGFIIGIIKPLHLLYKFLHFINVNIKSPIPTGWDYIFYNRESTFLVVTLNDDTKIKGWWGTNSFASEPEYGCDLYLERVYYKKGKNEWVEDKESKGIYISKDNIKYIEFKGESNE